VIELVQSIFLSIVDGIGQSAWRCGALGPGWALRPRARVWPEDVKKEITRTKQLIKRERVIGRGFFFLLFGTTTLKFV
jgi:hypothetical protein